MMRPSSIFLSISALAALLALACSRDEAPIATAPDRSAPWPATASSANATSGRVAKFRIAPKGSVDFELSRRRKPRVRGGVRIADGELTVDLDNLRRSRAQLRFDLGSIELEPLSEESTSQQDSARAQNWLELGASRPESARERLRWARYDVTEITASSADSASHGKLEKARLPAAGGSGGSENAGVTSTWRSVTMTVLGTLDIHGYRVLTPVDLHVAFEFPGGLEGDGRVSSVELKTAKPLNVFLQAHDIRPRDTLGRLLPAKQRSELGRLGSRVRVRLELHADLVSESAE